MCAMILSPQKRLKNLRTARELVCRAKKLHESAYYAPLEASLDSDEEILVRDVDAIQEAFKGPLALRVDFYSDIHAVRLVVHPPSRTDEYPYITPATYDALKVCLHTEDVRVDAPYDVAVMSNGVVRRVINGRKRT